MGVEHFRRQAVAFLKRLDSFPDTDELVRIVLDEEALRVLRSYTRDSEELVTDLLVLEVCTIDLGYCRSTDTSAVACSAAHRKIEQLVSGTSQGRKAEGTDSYLFYSAFSRK